MKPFDIYTFDFPGVGEHPAVILGTERRVGNKPQINILLCTSQRAARPALEHEVLLNGADGMDWETLCKCDLVYLAEKSLVKKKARQRFQRTPPPDRRACHRSLGFAGF